MQLTDRGPSLTGLPIPQPSLPTARPPRTVRERASGVIDILNAILVNRRVDAIQESAGHFLGSFRRRFARVSPPGSSSEIHERARLQCNLLVRRHFDAYVSDPNASRLGSSMARARGFPEADQPTSSADRSQSVRRPGSNAPGERTVGHLSVARTLASRPRGRPGCKEGDSNSTRDLDRPDDVSGGTRPSSDLKSGESHFEASSLLRIVRGRNSDASLRRAALVSMLVGWRRGEDHLNVSRGAQTPPRKPRPRESRLHEWSRPRHPLIPEPA